jgi:hypothetical protein
MLTLFCMAICGPINAKVLGGCRKVDAKDQVSSWGTQKILRFDPKEFSIWKQTEDLHLDKVYGLEFHTKIKFIY